MILLECLPKESSIPQDVLSHFNTSFAYAKKGTSQNNVMIMLALMVGMMILVLVMIMMGMMMLVLIMIMMIIMVG